MYDCFRANVCVQVNLELYKLSKNIIKIALNLDKCPRDDILPSQAKKAIWVH